MQIVLKLIMDFLLNIKVLDVLFNYKVYGFTLVLCCLSSLYFESLHINHGFFFNFLILISKSLTIIFVCRKFFYRTILLSMAYFCTLLIVYIKIVFHLNLNFHSQLLNRLKSLLVFIKIKSNHFKISYTYYCS